MWMVQPKKAKKIQTQFTGGGDCINYPGKVAIPTAETLVEKLIFNSVISTEDAQFMTMDISNFYLMTPLSRPNYIWIKLSNIRGKIIKDYNLLEKATKNESIYIKANKGMYGLLHARLLANKLLKKWLNTHGYWQSKLVPAIWKHDWHPIQFTLVVDDFGVRYVGKEHALHLKASLKEDYKVTTKWDGKLYISITLDWDYK